MAAVDLVLRRSSRIAQHPHLTPKRRLGTAPHEIEPEGDSSTSESDELTPRALRALKRQRLTLDSHGLPLPVVPHIETLHRRKRRKENVNLIIPVVHTNSVKEVRRRVRPVRVRPRAQSVSKSRQIHLQPRPTPILALSTTTSSPPVVTQAANNFSILAPKDNDPPPRPLSPVHDRHSDAHTRTTPRRSPSPIYRPPSPVPITQHRHPSPSSADLRHHVVVDSTESQLPPLPSLSQSSHASPPSSPSIEQKSSSSPPSQAHPPLHQIPIQNLDSLIPLDPLPDFPPSYTNSPDFPSNSSFASVQIHEFPSGGDMNNAFNSTHGSSFSSPGAFGSNHNPFPSNPDSFSNNFGTGLVPPQSHSQLDFSPSQDNGFSNTGVFPSSPGGFQTPLSNGFTSQSLNGFPSQSNDYSQSGGYAQSNGYPQQGAFSQSNHLSHTGGYEYAPVPHRDREVNIWKLACQERVEFLLHRYGIETIKALVASEAHVWYPSSSMNIDASFSSNHASNTRFRLYTPASYLERASYTYKSAEFDGMDLEMDDDDDDDDDMDFGCEGDEYDEEDYEDYEEGEQVLFPMELEVMEGGKRRDGGKVVIGSGRESEISMSSIVPPTVPPISLMSSIHQTSESPSPLGTVDIHSSLDMHLPSISNTHPSPQPLCTPPPSISPANQMTTPPATKTTSPFLPRTPPLSSLHVSLLSEPPRAFMGRGTPPDRRRLSEWGCVQVRGRDARLYAHAQVMSGEDKDGECMTEAGEEHGEVLRRTVEDGERTAEAGGDQPITQQGESLGSPNGEHLPTHGEWTNVLFAMLEGDGTGSAAWYELEASAPVPVSNAGEGVGTLSVSQSVGVSASQSGSTLSVSQSVGVGTLNVPQTVGEAESTLRFALG